MKTLFRIFVIGVVILCTASAQTLVNREWVSQYGLPDSIAWSASTTDASSNLYTTGNTLSLTNGADVLLTKYDSDGNVVWQETYDHQGGNDYGAAILWHQSGEVTVAAALYTSADSFDVGLLRYDANGTLLWSASYDYDQQYDVPTGLAEDGSGNLYVCAASHGGTTDLDYLTLKFDQNGNLLWNTSYDFAAGRDVPVSLVVGNEITVTGASEDSTGQWDFYTVMYDANGAVLEDYRLDKPGIGFDEPAGIARDASGNFYLTGRASDNGVDYYIQTVKLDAQLNLLWEVTYNHSGQDGATGLGLDSQGNVYVSGYLAEPLGQELLLVKYDANGNLVWDKIETAENGGPAAATSLYIDWQDNIYITGYKATNSQQRLYVAAFKSDGSKIWERSVEDGEYLGSEIITNGTDAYVSAKGYSNGSYQYVAIKYAFWDAFTTVVLDSLGKPSHTRNEVIAQFAPEALHNGPFSTTDIVFGNISAFVRSELLDELELQEGLSNIRQAYAYKIFPNLVLADSISITRLGDTISVPFLWTTLVIRLPEPVSTIRSGTNFEELAASGFSQMYPYVWYSEPNLISRLSIGANDNKYSNKQLSLHNQAGNTNPVDINIEPAWDIETGKPHIRVGIFDSGIRWSHNDFCNINKDDFAESRIRGGWDFVDNIDIANNKDNDDDDFSHGTKVAGIIGAIRNNNKGVAGIAGGNDDAEPGVSLFAMKIGRPIIGIPSTTAAVGIIDGALSNPSRGVGSGLHIFNHSWSGDGSQTIFRAMNTAYRNQVISVVAMGNELSLSGDAKVQDMPGIFIQKKDNYVISVGATGLDGNYAVNGENSGASPFTSRYGEAVDIVAPGIKDLVFTTDEGPRWSVDGNLIYQDDHSYHVFDGTSASAPHVSGVAALMLSHFNQATPSALNLSPEDVEEMIQLYADPLPNSTSGAPISTSSSPNELTGHGRLNAGRVLEHLDISSPFDILHFEHNTPVGGFSLVQQNVIAEFTEGALSVFYQSNSPSTIILPDPTTVLIEGPYVIDVYRYTATVPHNLSSTTNILAHWVRGSSTGVLLNPETQPGTSTQIFSGDPGFIISNVTPTSADVEAYVYFIKNEFNGPLVNQWFPFNPATETGRLAWTLHTEGATTSIEGQSVEDEFTTNAFPNPTSDVITITVENVSSTYILTEILSSDGRVLKRQNDRAVHGGSNQFEVNLMSFPDGVYLIKVSDGSKLKTLKVIKGK